MKQRITWAVFHYVLLILCCVPAAQAYRLATHNDLSIASAGCSVMAETGFMEGIGWKPIHKVYSGYTFNRAAVNSRLKGENKLTAQALIGWGAKYEDEAFKTRPLNHFFNPLKDQPSSVPVIPIPLGNTSPDWALAQPQPQPQPESIREQENSFFDANDYFLSALIARDKPARKKQWENVFLTFGMVIHHIQDMAQPQHTRNAAHCDGDIENVNCYGFHNPSYYEEYTNSKPIRRFIVDTYACGAEQAYDELSLSTFNSARDFWATAKGEGIGIAEFSNRNFVTKDTNFKPRQFPFFDPYFVPDANFPQPDPENNGEGVIIETVDIQHDNLLGPSSSLTGTMQFFGTYVSDVLVGSNTLNERTSSYSLWDDRLEKYNIDLWDEESDAPVRRFNLNSVNFQRGYDFLMPRAISYSAGLINYFFRGRMAVSNVQYLGDTIITITVKNVTADKNPGNAAYSFSDGEFSLYFDDVNDMRHRLEKAVDAKVTLSDAEHFANEDEIELAFKLDNLPFSVDIKKPFTLVFDGKIGHINLDEDQWERGIAANTFYAEPLLAFDVSVSDGRAPVPNVIDIYASYDLGVNWLPVSDYGYSVAFSDDTLDPYNRLGVNAAVYTGNGELLVYPDYLDYYSGSFNNIGLSLSALHLGAFGAENATPVVPLDWGTVINGAGNNVADHLVALRSLTATGVSSLAALRVKHPLSTDPEPRIRSFELLQIPDWHVDTDWLLSNNWGQGGLPELSWLGNDTFIMAVQVEDRETLDPGARERDAVLRKTDNGGLSYTNLTAIADCDIADTTCVQHIIPLDEGRLMGWIEQHASDYPATTALYLSEDGGSSWIQSGTVPDTEACAKLPLSYTELNTLIYMGSHRKETVVNNVSQTDISDVLFIESTCKEIVGDNGSYAGVNTLSNNVFASKDSGRTWTEVVNPPHFNGRIIYAGDNGVVPGVFE